MDVTAHNQEAWNTGAHEAWIERFGQPAEAAARLLANPLQRAGDMMHYMGDVTGKRIANLLGSHGHRAVAWSLLGADVTVVDFSHENAAYATALAREAGVAITYMVGDVRQSELPPNTFDFVCMERGIVHYFTDLQPLFRVVYRCLRPGGQLVLQDFHPVTTKLLQSRGTTAATRKHKVAGDYFFSGLVEKEIPFAKYQRSGEGLQQVQTVHLRQWTLGEIVTAAAQEQLRVCGLYEEPHASTASGYDAGIPKTFTLVAAKPSF